MFNNNSLKGHSIIQLRCGIQERIGVRLSIMMTVVMEQLGPVCEQYIVHCKSIAAFTTVVFLKVYI